MSRKMSYDRSASSGAAALAEMMEFAGFDKRTQRYIRRSLDVGLARRDATRRWARDPRETAAIRSQYRAYERLDLIRQELREDPADFVDERIMSPLIAVTALDLASGRLPTFTAYRFLYERLFGANVRPWLPSAFCAAAALPHLHPDARRELLRSVSEATATAAGWSSQGPCFFPEWVEKVEPAIAA